MRALENPECQIPFAIHQHYPSAPACRDAVGDLVTILPQSFSITVDVHWGKEWIV